TDALQMAARPADPELREIIESVRPSVAAGVPLHRALERHRDRLPAVVIPVLESAEATNSLHVAAQRLSNCFARIAELDGRFRFSLLNLTAIMAIFIVNLLAVGISSFLLAGYSNIVETLV